MKFCLSAIFLYVLLFIGLNVHAQTPEGVIDTKFTKMFAKNCCGVTGADGEYSVLLPDGRTVWIFGDSFLGTVRPDRSREKMIPWFIRNSMAVQEADTLRTIHNVIDGQDRSLVIPPDAPKGKQFSEDSLWYWPGDGFIENGKLKVFMTGFYQAKPGDWGFAWTSANIATFSLPEIKLERIDHFSYPGVTEVHWGHAVCDGDSAYTYIYGAENATKNLYAARALKGNILAPWEFYTGCGWSSDPKLARPMLAIQGSEQFSVFKLNGKYVLVVQEGGFMTGEVVSYYSDTPYGTWKNRKVLCHVKLPADVSSTANLFGYNSLAHPQFTENGQLLISTCINSFVVDDVFRDASKYRPVFQRVPVSRIFEPDQHILKSQYIPKDDTVWIFTPAEYAGNPAKSYPVVYMLHGWSGSYHHWNDITDCQALADRYGFILVCPDGLYDSWYINSPAIKESRYADFFFRDLMPFTEKNYRVQKENVFITGLSMGGHGALYLFSLEPERFRSAGSLSGVLDLSFCWDEYRIKDYLGIKSKKQGSQLLNEYSVSGNIDRIASSGKKIIFTCGRSDRFFPLSNSFEKQCEEKGVDATYIISPGGHDKEYWKSAIGFHFDFFSKMLLNQ